MTIGRCSFGATRSALCVQLSEARAKVEAQQANHMSSEAAEELLNTQADKWNTFYGNHEERFFRDRKWLFTEFPELSQASTSTVTTENEKCVLS